MSIRRFLSVGLVSFGWLSFVVFAADVFAADSAMIEEIIVTAERKESSLQATPIAISAFSESFLEESNISNIQDLAPYTPGLNFTKVSNFVQLNMRGIGLEQINLGGEPGVAFHQDGVYIARPFVNDAVFLDLARVEVLRGPQGTLYGRNATGGSVNVISNKPTEEFSGSVSLTLGNYDRVRAAALVNGALDGKGKVRGRLAIVTDTRDGYLDNLANGDDLEDNDTRSIRGQLAIDVSESLSVLLSADYMREDDTGPMFRPGKIAGTAADLGGRLTSDPYKIYVDGPSDHDLNAKGASIQLDWNLGEIDLMSLTAYRENRFSLLSDLDGTDFFLLNEDLNESTEQFSQEFQISSSTGNLDWMMGAYYFREDGDLYYAFPIPLFGTTIIFDSAQETRAYALFGQMTYQFNEDLSLTFGLRYSDEDKKGNTTQVLFVAGRIDVEQNWDAWTPRIVLDYQINPDTFVYGSISRGFKTGGINTGSLQTAAYDPEFIWNYEVGLKSDLLDHRVRANLAAYYYKYEDLQVIQYAVGQSFIENAADADGRGIEAELQFAVSEFFRVDVALSYLRAEFDKYSTDDSFRPALGRLDLSGNSLPRAPEFTASLVAQYDIPLKGNSQLSIRGEYQHQDEFYFTSFNTNFAQGGEFNIFNAQISYRSQDDRWNLAMYGRNLTNEEYEQATTVSGINGGTLEQYGAPRTYGFQARYQF